MANPEHLDLLRQGVEVWNAWRANERSTNLDLSRADLTEEDLHEANLGGANLSEADLSEAKLHQANLSEAYLSHADLSGADLSGADLSRANLSHADLRSAALSEANLSHADLSEADLSLAGLCKAYLHRARLLRVDLRLAYLDEANLSEAYLVDADLNEAHLRGANLCKANLDAARLFRANLTGAKLIGGNLRGADLRKANLTGANLTGAHLGEALLVETNLENTNLTGCRIYGVSAWNVKLSDDTKQRDLVITREDEPPVTVDDLEVAQFVYLLLHNEKIRSVIDTVGKKGVLLLGRFTEGRIAVLDRLRDELRKRGYLPIVFNFDKPDTKDFTETIRLLAGLSKFVIADVTNPKSAPLELQATVPELMIPFQPIIEEGQEPFSMLRDLWIKHRDWVFDPVHYSSVDALVASFDKEIIEPAEARFDELVMRKAETMRGRHV